MKIRFALLAATACVSAPAMAQDGGASEARASSMEIVVTATRRAENVQDIPNAITVMTDERLKQSGVDNVLTLEGLTPGVKVQSQAAAANIYVRGVGTQGLISDPSAPLFIDGVFVGRGTATNSLFFDLARVEILKGPQGTLYGRNAVAGAVNLVSAAPTDKLEGSLRVGYGSFDRWSGEAVLNMPVTEDFALRGAIRRVRDDGYLSNGGNQTDDFGARLQALLNPAENVTLRVIGDYYRQNGRGPSTLPIFAAAGTTAGVCSGERFCHPGDPWYTPERAGHVKVKNWGLTADLTVDLGGAKLTVLPSHRSSKSEQFSFVNNNAAGATFDIGTNQDSIEVRLLSDHGGPFKWIVGALHHDEQTELLQIIPGIFGGPGIFFGAYTEVPSNKVRANSAFAEGTYSVTDALRFTLGARYTDEKRTQSGRGYVIFTTAPFPLTGLPANIFSVNGRFEDSKLTWKAAAEYDLSPDSLLYASVSTGFKSGGINREAPVTPAGAAFDNTFDSEEVTAFAVGSKNKFMDGRAIINFEAFYWNYDNRQNEQFSALNSNPPPITARDLRTFNLGKTRIYGLEIAGAFRIGPDGLLEIAGSYLNAKYRNDPANNFPATMLALNPFVTLTIEPGADLRGRTLAFAPKWSGTIVYSHNFGLGDLGSLRARVESQLQAASFTQYRLAPQSRQPGYTKTSLSLTWTDRSDRFSLTGYVRNIEDEAVIRTTAATALTTASPLYFGYIEAPRTWGVEFGVKF